jgi:hypothetical protein
MTFSLVTLLMVDWPGSQKNEIVDGHKSIKIFYLPAFLMLLCISLGVGLTVNMFSENLRIDKAGENIYATINSDVAGLIKSGDIQSNALIISAADGYPFQLMSPLQLEFPPLQVLPLGWNAFSPAYDSVLARYGIDSIDKALLTRPDVYMVSRKDFIPVVTRFYKEHENIEVSVKEIYVLGGPIYAAQNSNNLILYHLVAH